MHQTSLHSTILLACALTSAGAFAETVTFELIPTAVSANDMSPDGRFIVGERAGGTLYILDRATNTMSIVPGPGYAANAVSDDGAVVLGNMDDATAEAQVAALWSSGTNSWSNLGYLQNAMACPSLSSAYELSADGSVAVGLSWDGCSGRGFRWTEETGMLELEMLANGGNRASVVSADGSLIGGFAQGSFSRTPAIWDADGSGMLLDLHGEALGEVHGINDSGSVLLGTWDGDAVKWTYPGLIRKVIATGSILPGWEGIPQDIADDGTIVGFDFLLGNRRAWIQPQGEGNLIELVSYIESHGGDVPDEIPLHVAQAISADGTTIIGHGAGTGAWIVTITPDPVPCAGDIVSSTTFAPPPDGQVDAADLAFVLGAWGRNPGSPADLVSSKTFQPPPDGMVDAADLAFLLGEWGLCE